MKQNTIGTKNDYKYPVPVLRNIIGFTITIFTVFHIHIILIYSFFSNCNDISFENFT